MRKRNCRMTDYEKECHEKAVKLRKMTDIQLCEYLEEVANAKRGVNLVQEYLESLIIPGVGKTTVDKLKEFARAGGYID